MKTMKNIIKTSIIAALVAGLTLVNSVGAEAKSCRSVYGGGEVCEYGDISIDKQVYNPETNEYWDNIDSSSYTFEAGDEVKFQIKVKNISDIKIDKLMLRDYFPNYIDWIEGGNWLWDRDIAEWEINDLDPDEEVFKTVKVKIFDENDIPEGITCVTNKAIVTNEDDEEKSDTASFCMQKGEAEPKVLGETMPDTGASLPTVVAIELMSLGVIGAGYLIASKKRI
jgi:uncharacterized protein DUF11